MQTCFEEHDKLGTLRIVGEMTLSHANNLKTALLEALAKSDELYIDLASVKEIDSAGLQMLLLVKREATNLHRMVSLVSPSSVVVEMLELYRITSFFEAHSFSRGETAS